MSALLAAGSFDTWPTAASQIGSLPTGSASANNWVASSTVTDVRFYNLGGTIASIGSASSTAVMQAAVILT